MFKDNLHETKCSRWASQDYKASWVARKWALQHEAGRFSYICNMGLGKVVSKNGLCNNRREEDGCKFAMQDWLVPDWLVQDCTTKTAMQHALYYGLRKIFVQDGFCKTGLRYLICTTSFSFFVFPPLSHGKKADISRRFYLGLPGCWQQYFSVKISSMKNLSPDVVYDSAFKWFMQHPCSPLPALLSEVVQVPEKLVANLCFGKSQPPSVKLRCNFATKIII